MPATQNILHEDDADEPAAAATELVEATTAERLDGSDGEDASGDDAALPHAGFTRRTFMFSAATAAMTFSWGLAAGFWIWGRDSSPVTAPVAAASIPAAPVVATTAPAPEPPQLGLPHSYTLPVAYGRLGPQLIDAGAFTYDGFTQVYAAAGQPLTEQQQAILLEGSDEAMVIDPANAYFLLNLLWALGLTNNNRLLREGMMIEASGGQVERFASVGGWSLTAKPINQLYSSAALVTLNDAQQADVAEAAAVIYRPCCNNPTSFPDCNHGMAMLGLLQLMAARNVDVAGMLDAAKQVNSFWYPAQSKDLALFYQAQTGQNFAAIPAQEAVGPANFSSAGYKEVRAWLAANNRLDVPNQNGSSCGV